MFDFYASATTTAVTVPGQYNVTQGVNAGHTFVVNEIGAGTYCYNSALKEIVLPATVLAIKDAAFSGCSSLNKITFEGTVPPELEGDPFASVNKGMCAVYVPAKMVKTYRESNDLWNEFIFATPVSASKQYVSFCSDVPFTTRQFNGTGWVVGSDYKMYWADKSQNANSASITISPTRDREFLTIPAGFGLVMKTGANGGSGYIFMPPTGAPERADLIADNNMLKGVLVETDVDDIIDANPNNTYYYLTDCKFKKLVKGNDNKIAAGRAYLEISGLVDSGARMFITLEDDVTDGILVINEDEQSVGDAYDMQGRKIAEPSKGVYIKNGKKYIK